MNRVQIGDRQPRKPRSEGAGGPPLGPARPAPHRLENSTNAVRAVGYIRVSTDEQADSGLGLAAQTAAIEQEAARRGWQLVAVERDAASGKSLARRPALARCLDALAAGRADTLIVAKLDRLARSAKDFAELLDRFNRQRWGFVALDLGVDTSSPSGEVMAHVMAAFAQFERRLIGQRTKDALAQRRRQGVKLGRPRAIAATVEARIGRRRAAGWTMQRIADAEGLAVSTVQRVLDRA